MRKSITTIIIGLAWICATAYRVNAGIFTFSNIAPITINEFGPATPYPAIINVSGLNNLRILDLNVTLTGLSHTFPNDIGFLLVAPGGQTVVLINGAGGDTPITNVNITLDDEAAASLPFSGGIASGTYIPTNFFPADVFPAPAPGGPYGSLLSVFDNTDPNGAWRLYINDFAAGDSGLLAGGFSLQISVAEPPSLLLLVSGLFTLAVRMRRREQ